MRMMIIKIRINRPEFVNHVGLCTKTEMPPLSCGQSKGG
jgi:hypothetical protein